MATAVTYARGFFDLQLGFAETVSALSGLSLERAVLDYTNCYIRFGLGRDFDPNHPSWQAYLAGLGAANDRGEWTYRFYLMGSPAVSPPGVVATFGCFSYARLGSDRIRLHFHDAEGDGRSPLGQDCCERRRAELAALVAHARRTGDPAPSVVGRSWLYNLAAYRRLFPPSYLATARVAERLFRHMPLWGQFLNRRGEVREDMARGFRERLRRASLETLDECFPFPVLSLEAPLSDFDDFYGVESAESMRPAR